MRSGNLAIGYGHMSSLLFFLPDEAYPVLLILLGIAVVAGLARPRLLLGLLLLLFLLPVISELFDVFVAAIPWWLFVLIIGGLTLSVVRGALAVLIGSEAASHAIGLLTATAIKGIFKLAFLPFRVIVWWIRKRTV